MGIEEILADKRDEILKIARKHGAHNVRVFGSVARGEATEGSDVDLLVELEDGRSLLDHVALVMELEELLRRKVEIVEPVALHWYIKDSILREAVPV